ncbi:hypothetical protein CTI12_AA188800 [Artemisia annua]|uniref:Uncharacterized protein n=1 Tax=Artemisia annua TaxID=35608 RepID=A0A2U1P6C1_ARTAN|nr:hypothetical protein CTI12_AA188800 [Artemisia annua]
MCIHNHFLTRPISLAAPAIVSGVGALAPTLGTIMPVIGAGGFAAVASAIGSVAGSIAVAASFGGDYSKLLFYNRTYQGHIEAYMYKYYLVKELCTVFSCGCLGIEVVDLQMAILIMYPQYAFSVFNLCLHVMEFINSLNPTCGNKEKEKPNMTKNWLREKAF